MKKFLFFLVLRIFNSFLFIFFLQTNTGQERGMRSIGITQYRMKSELEEWLQLSTQKNIPISLLIMSRAFSLTTSDDPEEVLKSSMSSLDSDTINEVVVAAAHVGEEKTLDMQKRKLESLKFQEEVKRNLVFSMFNSLLIDCISFFS
jgi:hypothetical protein